MHLVRSVLFAIAMTLVTLPYGLFAFLVFPLPPMKRYRIVTSWTRIVMWMVRVILGIRYKVIGEDNLPSQPAVILAKHQSAWETMAMQLIFPPVAFVLKRELLRVPFFGWGLAQMPGIAIDRSAGKDALAQVVDQGTQRLAEGFWVVVFPEGTRVAPGTSRRYKPGGAWLAKQAGAPVVPVAHNAGDFWRRNAFVKRPGEVIVSIGPVIDTQGLEAAEVNARSEEWIEAEMRRLFPHQYSRTGKAADAG